MIRIRGVFVNMEFVRLSPTIAQEWDDIVYHSDDGWMSSLYIWQKMITNISEWGYEDYSFAVYNAGQMVAVMPLQLTRGRNLVSAAMGWGGPVIISGIPESYRTKILRTVFEHVREIADQVQARKVQIAISPLNQTSLNSRWGVNFLINYGFQDLSTHTRITNLLRPESELWSDLSQDARQKIKRARAAGYTVQRTCWRDMLDEYYRVHVETYHRTGATPHPKAYFEGIATLIAEQGHAVLWVGRDHEGRPVAFHNCARFRQTSLYWTGCCETAHLESGINYLLFWYALLGAKEDGCTWYEIGEVFPGVSQEKLHGLTVFKSKFGGELHRFFRGEIILIEPQDISVKPTIQTLGRNWLHATRELLLPILGERIVSFIAKAVRSTYRLVRKAVNIALSFKRKFFRIFYPSIPFIKPFWSLAEKRIGFLEVSLDEQAALQQFIDAFREKLKVGDEALIIPTGSGRTALELSLKVLKAKDPTRDKVILPSYGCRGTYDPIIKNGLTPIFVDVDDNLLPDGEKVVKLFSSEVLACLLVHLTGKSLDTRPIIQAARKHDIVVIEDHCQNTGGQAWRTDDRLQCDLAIYSFGIGKNVMASAGGALVTYILKEEFEAESKNLQPEDPVLAKERFVYFYHKFFELSGREKQKSRQLFAEVNQNQFNYVAMNPVDALIVVEQLRKLDAIIELRKRNATRIIEKLALFPNLFFLQSSDDHIYTKLSVRLRDRKALNCFRDWMASRGIELEGMYTPLHLRDFARGFGQGSLEVTERIHSLVINIPVRPNLTEREVKRIADAVEEFGRSYADVS